jgi:hypothetical protein
MTCTQSTVRSFKDNFVNCTEIISGTDTHKFFILVINQLDAQNLFYNKFIHASTRFEQVCSKQVETWNKLTVQQILYNKLVNY